MKLQKASFKEITYACRNFHYSKSVPVNPFGFSVFNEKKEWCGVVTYSLGANPNLGKPYGLSNGEFCELTRMALNGKQEITSKILSLSLKLLPKYCPLVRLVISFADQNQNHFGTIYQATNWYFSGEGASTHEYFYRGRWMHQRQLGSVGVTVAWGNKNLQRRIGKDKFRYLFPIDKSLISLCQSLSKPYPKKYAAIAQGSAGTFQVSDDSRTDLAALIS